MSSALLGNWTLRQYPQNYFRMTHMVSIISFLLCIQTICALQTPTNKKQVTDEALAQRIEKILAVGNDPKVEKVKAQLADQIEYNFIKTLSAMLISDQARAQEDQKEILTLLRQTLNGDLNFKPVVDKMPLLLRENETKRFTMIVKTIGKVDRGSRQFGGLQNISKILDVASKINPKEVGTFLKEIPQIFEGVESIVDGADEYFNEATN